LNAIASASISPPVNGVGIGGNTDARFISTRSVPQKKPEAGRARFRFARC
jgi:hypothetical protein